MNSCDWHTVFSVSFLHALTQSPYFVSLWFHSCSAKEYLKLTLIIHKYFQVGAQHQSDVSCCALVLFIISRVHSLQNFLSALPWTKNKFLQLLIQLFSHKFVLSCLLLFDFTFLVLLHCHFHSRSCCLLVIGYSRRSRGLFYQMLIELSSEHYL